MISKTRVLIALIVAGLFLVPSTAVFGSSDSAGAMKKTDASVPITPVITDPAAYGTPSPLKGDSKETPKMMAVPQGPFSRDQFTLPQDKASGGRGPRAGPDAALIGLEVVWPVKVDQWVWAGVMALKGADTQFNVTVNNSGTDPTTADITVVFAIQDYFGKDMTNQTQSIHAPLGSGENQTLYFHWIPAYCTYFRIVIITTTPGDADTTNDFSRYGANFNNALLAVALWADPCSDMSSWSGGAGDTGTDRNWHIDTNPKTDNATQHSAPDVLYHGKDGLVRDEYENNKDIAVHTPNFDFRKFGSSYFLHLSYLFRGTFPATDPGDYVEQQFSTDSGANWGGARVKMDSSILNTPQTPTSGYYNWYTDINGNGQMDINEIGLEISGDVVGKTAMLRNHFVSNSAITDLGVYTDDYIIWGMEIQNDVGVQIVNDLGAPALGDTVSVNVTVTNTGSNPQSAAFNATLNITHRGDPLHMLAGFPMLQPVNALTVGASQTVTFSWNPAESGDFVLVVNVTGAKDENPVNNADARWMRVSGANPQILVVDDNPWGSPLNSTDKLTGILASDAVGFANYGRWYWSTGGDGPSADFMKKFDVVVWTTGWDNNQLSANGTLTANDQANLKSYLNSGGALWLASMELINDLGQNSTFVKNTLHVASAKNNTEIKGDELGPAAKNQPILPNPLMGEPGSLADGMVAFTSMPPTTNSSFDWTDLIWSDGQSSGVFWGNDSQTSDPSGPHVAIQYAGSYRLVFQSFDPIFMSFTPNLTDYVSRVLGFLMGGLSSEVGAGGIPNDHQLVDPGGQAEYTMTISNGGTKLRTLWNLDITQPPSGWTVTASPMVTNGDNPLDIAPGNSVDITLTVTAPQKALAGATAPIDITASFKSYTGALKNSTVTEVRAILGAGLTATVTVQNMTGPGVASFSFTLSNLGNLQVTAELTKTGDHADSLVLSSPTVTLQPYEQRLLSAVMTVSDSDSSFKQAGNYTLKDILTARVTYQGAISTANLTLTTNIRIAQIFSVKIDDVVMDPVDGQADMSIANPKVKLTVSVTAASANGNDTSSIELKAKSFTPTSGSSRAWDGSGWTLPKTTIDTTTFMVNAQNGLLTVLVNPKADPGDYVIEVRATPGSGRLTDGDTTQVTIRVARPDLQIVADSLVYNPKEPQVGSPVTIKVTVKNAGGVAARNIDVYFYGPGGNQIGDTQRIDELAALSGTKTVQVSWDGVAEGENDIDIKVDPNNLIFESDKTNNELTDNTLIGYRSDVVIDAQPVFMKAGIAKTSVTDGDTVTIEADVKNEGTWGLNLTGVTVTMTDQTTGETQTQTISINTRSDTKVDFTWAAHKVGTHTFSIKATPDATTINEKSTTNNEQTATLKVNAQPTSSAGIGGTMLYALIGVVVIIIVVALAMVMMRRKPAARAAAPAEEKVDVVEAESVEVEGETR